MQKRLRGKSSINKFSTTNCLPLAWLDIGGVVRVSGGHIVDDKKKMKTKMKGNRMRKRTIKKKMKGKRKNKRRRR